MPSDLPIVKLFLDLYVDDFGTYKDVYNTTGGVYLVIGTLPQILRQNSGIRLTWDWYLLECLSKITSDRLLTSSKLFSGDSDLRSVALSIGSLLVSVNILIALRFLHV